MRVAIVINTSWNIYNFRLNFVKTLLEQGHEVHTIAPADEYTSQLTAIGCIHHNIYMDSRGANPIKDFALMVELTTLYMKVNPEVVLHYTIKPNVYGSMAAALAGIPSINNVCGLGTVFLKDGLVSKIAKLLYKISFRFPKKVFFQNPDDLQLFLDKRILKKEKTDLLPGSGIDLRHFVPEAFKRNNVFTFLAVSRLIYDKGILEYIDAIRLLKAKGVKARFQLLGAEDPQHKRGIPAADVQQWIDEGLIEYLGKTDDVRPYLSAADCVVLPSYREGSPRSLMEAAAMGKPIVATNVPGCNQVVIGGLNGLLCSSHNAEDLADKMLHMTKLSDPVLQMMGECGRRKMELEFSDSIIANKYLSALRQLEHDSLVTQWA